MEITSNKRVRVRVRRPSPPARHLSLIIGVALSVLPTTVHARGKHPLSPRQVSHAAPPWSGTSGFPPPRPFVRVGGPPASIPAPARAVTHDKEVVAVKQAASPIKEGSVHPAWHRRDRRNGPISRLFPRAGATKKTVASDETARSERAASMARHPAGKALRAQAGAQCNSRHQVVAGDSLWEIASDALDTDAEARVDSYWPRVYETNRAVIGENPDLIRPGQVLELPPCE